MLTGDIMGDALVPTAIPESNLVYAGTFVLANPGDEISESYIKSRGKYFAWAQYNNPDVFTDYQIMLERDKTVYLGFSAYEAVDDWLRYGWIEIGLNDRGTLEVLSSAWDIDGGPVVVGMIPEPSQILMYLLGIAAFALKRMPT